MTGDNEQRGRSQYHRPAGIDHCRKRYGKDGSDNRADERHEAHESGNELRVFAPRSRRKRSVGPTRAGGE
jgi:hypothetical protein